MTQEQEVPIEIEETKEMELKNAILQLIVETWRNKDPLLIPNKEVELISNSYKHRKNHKHRKNPPYTILGTKKRNNNENTKYSKEENETGEKSNKKLI